MFCYIVLHFCFFVYFFLFFRFFVLQCGENIFYLSEFYFFNLLKLFCMAMVCVNFVFY